MAKTHRGGQKFQQRDLNLILQSLDNLTKQKHSKSQVKTSFNSQVSQSNPLSKSKHSINLGQPSKIALMDPSTPKDMMIDLNTQLMHLVNSGNRQHTQDSLSKSRPKSKSSKPRGKH